MPKIIKTIVLIPFALLVLATIRGRSIDLINSQSVQDTSPGGPYEGSNNTSRYALTEAIVNNHTFFFTREQADFGAPDVVRLYDRYFTVFTPGISFLGIPLYMFGQLFGVPQIASYLTITLFSLLNIFLVFKLSARLTSSKITAVLCGFLFLFSTNALAYSNTYTQHHVAATVVLSALLTAFSLPSFRNAVFMGFIVSAGILTDIPVAIYLIPILIHFCSEFVLFKKNTGQYKLSVNLRIFGLILGLLPLVALFGCYNYRTTGSFTTLAQSVGRAAEFDPLRLGIPDSSSPKSRIPLPYSPRKLIRGLYILLISNERGWYYYSPVIVFGLIGLILAVRNPFSSRLAIVTIGIILAIVVPYAMFGDPWGGWAFGPRYLIPASAVICPFITLFLDRIRRNWFLKILFMAVAFYGAYLASLGTLTTNLIPPKVEAVQLSVPIPYTPEYNRQLLAQNISGSLIFNTFLNQFISAEVFHLSFTVITCLIIGTLYLFSQLSRHATNKF